MKNKICGSFTSLGVASMVLTLFVVMLGGFAPHASGGIVNAVEYYHQDFEHYFVSSNPAEIAVLDSGVYRSWWRSGQRYRVDDAPGPELVPVCRFYTSAFAGKASHFFTASVDECEQLKASPVWTYEGVAFYAQVPDAEGACKAGTAAVHRLYNNGQGGSPNHAYVTAETKRRLLIVEGGWIAEGVAYCVPLAEGDPRAKTLMLAGSTWELPGSVVDGSATVKVAFQTTATTGPDRHWVFLAVGLEPQDATIHFNRVECCLLSGSVSWDSITGTYVVVDNSRIWPDPWVVAIAWNFVDALGPVVTVCTMTAHFNILSREPFRLHAVQRYLWSGCSTSNAQRL